MQCYSNWQNDKQCDYVEQDGKMSELQKILQITFSSNPTVEKVHFLAHSKHMQANLACTHRQVATSFCEVF